jgi:hypothetical protein
MEVARRFAALYPNGYDAYLALQCALMRHYIARGGTASDFCARLAPAFRRRHRTLLDTTD